MLCECLLLLVTMPLLILFDDCTNVACMTIWLSLIQYRVRCVRIWEANIATIYMFRGEVPRTVYEDNFNWFFCVVTVYLHDSCCLTGQSSDITRCPKDSHSSFSEEAQALFLFVIWCPSWSRCRMVDVSSSTSVRIYDWRLWRWVHVFKVQFRVTNLRNEGSAQNFDLITLYEAALTHHY